MHSDSILNTGITSVSDRKVRTEQAKRERKEKQFEKKQKLLPSAEVVIEEIKKEKENAKLELLSTVGIDSTDEDVKSMIIALNLYTESMDRIINRINRIMRTKDGK